jgi:GTPase SAR1 family protein
LKSFISGLDNAGKTTFLHMISLLDNPTDQIDLQTFNFMQQKMLVGKHAELYYANVAQYFRIHKRVYFEALKDLGLDWFVFMLDGNDSERADDMKALFQSVRENLEDCSILILINKIDLRRKMQPFWDISQVIDFLELREIKNVRWMVRCTSMIDRQGLKEPVRIIG